MKRIWRKIGRSELLYDYIMFSVLVLIAGGLLVVQIIKIAGHTGLAVRDTYFAMFSVAAVLAVLILTGLSLCKKSIAYIAWYKEIFNAIPMPLIVTGEDAEWLQINRATRKAMNLNGKSNFKNLNSRHLVDEKGNVPNRTWLHNGKNYQVAGKPLRCGGKYAGYLIFLKDVPDVTETNQIHTEMLDKVHRHIKQISTETEYLRGCANNISGHMLWQSNIIADLLGIIDEIASGNLTDPEELNERIYVVKANMQSHTENSKADLENLRRVVAELKDAYDYSNNCFEKGDTA